MIPIYLLMMCCILGTPIAGIILLVYLFRKDRQLGINLLISTLMVTNLALIYPAIVSMFEFLSPLLNYSIDHTPFNFTLIYEIIAQNLGDTLFMILIGLTIGFMVSIIVTIPTTFLVRKIKKHQNSNQN